MIHLYTGDGKGKTSAATGLAVRMLGHQRSVLFCRFLKGKSGETEPLISLGAQVVNAPHSGKFTFQMSPEEICAARAANMDFLADLRKIVREGGFALIVLDEIVDAVNANLLDVDEVIGFVQEIPPGVEIVLTGRDPDAKLAAMADYYTEFFCHAHPYEKGVAARRGVEY